MELSALERARRMEAMMEILGEENQDGVRVIQRDPDPSKRDGDLFARLMAMASYPSEKYRDSLKIMHHLSTERRFAQGPYDVYIEALHAFCKPDPVGVGGGLVDQAVAGGGENLVNVGGGNANGSQGDGNVDGDPGEKHGGSGQDSMNEIGGHDDGNPGGVEGDVGGDVEEELVDDVAGDDGNLVGENGGGDEMSDQDVDNQSVSGGNDVGDGVEEELVDDIGGGQSNLVGEHGGGDGIGDIGDIGDQDVVDQSVAGPLGHEENDIGVDAEEGLVDEVGAGLREQSGDNGKNRGGCAGVLLSASMVNELESLSENHGPLSNSHMPKASVLVRGCPKVASIHPWRLDLWAPDSMLKSSIPEDSHCIEAGRRRTVARNYRSGRMYAILHDGRIAMSPNEDIQLFVDAQNKERGTTLTVPVWLNLVKASIIRHQALQMLKSVTSKPHKAQSRLSSGNKRKYKHKRTGSGGKSAKSTGNPFDVNNMSDEETEEEVY